MSNICDGELRGSHLYQLVFLTARQYKGNGLKTNLNKNIKISNWPLLKYYHFSHKQTKDIYEETCNERSKELYFQIDSKLSRLIVESMIFKLISI